MSMPTKCLISAGPTREWIDSVRFLSNPSSGKMGYELAEAAKEMGFEVTLVSGPVALSCPKGVDFIPVVTALEMRDALLKRFSQMDLMIMTAAVSDHRPEYMGKMKVKKDRFPATLKLIPNPDILYELGALKSSRQTLVGFAAESSNHLTNAQKKLEDKNLDWVVVNDISNDGIGFQSDKNEVTLLSRNNEAYTLPLASKKRIATDILKLVWK